MQFQVTTHDINQIHHNNNLFIEAILKIFPYAIYIFKVKSQQQEHQNNARNLFKVKSVFIVNFEQISHIILMFPLLTLNK